MNRVLIFVVLIIMFGCLELAFADQPPLMMDKQLFGKVEANLLNGLASENYGLKTSSAYFLGEMKSRKAVIPLLRMLHSGINDEAKIMAALSLIKIGDARGIYAVKQAVKFEDSKRVSKICERLYFAYLKQIQQLENIAALR